MTDHVAIQIPRPSVAEGSAFTAKAYFRDRATQAASAPSAVKWRVDCLTTGEVISDWVSETPAASVDISITAGHNAIQCDDNDRERRQLTVAADPDTDTQCRAVATWMVTNLKGLT